jgi:hypothetical protein
MNTIGGAESRVNRVKLLRYADESASAQIDWPEVRQIPEGVCEASPRCTHLDRPERLTGGERLRGRNLRYCLPECLIIE